MSTQVDEQLNFDKWLERCSEGRRIVMTASDSRQGQAGSLGLQALWRNRGFAACQLILAWSRLGQSRGRRQRSSIADVSNRKRA